MEGEEGVWLVQSQWELRVPITAVCRTNSGRRSGGHWCWSEDVLYQVGKEQEHCALSVIAVLKSVAQEMTNKGTKYFCKSCGTETCCVLSHYRTVTECSRAALKHAFVLSFPLFYSWPQFSHC